MKILSAKQFYEADAFTIKNQDLLSIDLMERAAKECFNWLNKKLGGAPVPIHIFCGIGNNGGDGLALGRMLIKHGYNVFTYIANFTDKRSHDFLINYNLIKEVSDDWPLLMTSKADFPEINSEDIVIDALFGIGLNRPAEGWVKKLIHYLNESKAFILSIDIPSGLFPDTPITKGDTIIKSKHTLTFQNPKLAFFLPDSYDFIPSFEVLDIGLDQEFIKKQASVGDTVGKFEAKKYYQTRSKFQHKGDFGHTLLIGGSYGKMGAIALASKAALKTGAGLVTAFIPKCGYNILQTLVPEAMTVTDVSEKNISKIAINFTPSAIGIGPGLGIHKKTSEALKLFLKKQKNSPLVLDADALNCISKNKEFLKLLPKQSILTPHPGELKRLIGDWKDDYHKIELTKKYSKKHQIIMLIKGANTLIIDGDKLYVNVSGNPGMATAGSGDVLTGMIVGLQSQGYKPLEAAIMGVYLHGSAGDNAASYLGFEAMVASDIIENIGNAYLDLLKNEDTPQNEN